MPNRNIITRLDNRSAMNVNTLNPKVQQRFKNWIIECNNTDIAKNNGYEYRAISGNRTFAEQQALYNQGRTTAGKIVTNAQQGFSNHNYGIAVDMGVFKNGKYLDVTEPSVAINFHRHAAQLAKKYGLEWGGDWMTFKDYPHFQYNTGKTITQLHHLVTQGMNPSNVDFPTHLRTVVASLIA